MTNLANVILLEVGYWQWTRMNFVRLLTIATISRAMHLLQRSRPSCFVEDMKRRAGRRDEDVTDYLQRRLTAQRLALPDGFDLWRAKANLEDER